MISRLPSAIPFGANSLRWFIPRDEPAHRAFRIAAASDGSNRIAVRKAELAHWPFCTLAQFTGDRHPEDRILLVAPLSGHFAFILREMVLGLVGKADIGVTDWCNARYVPLEAGDFGFDENIGTIARSIKTLGAGSHVVALCQAAMPALAATALIGELRPDLAPRSLTLIGGPVDPLANPTRVVQLLRRTPLDWFERMLLEPVGEAYPGAGRLVYPARHQFAALSAYFCRHWLSGGELSTRMLADAGRDAGAVPFLDLFTSLMDLPAKFFLENTQKVFQDRDAWTGGLRWRDHPVDFGAIRATALMTVEGAVDDIVAPGQTSAAHRLCRNIPAPMRRSLVVAGAGHFSLFQGRGWREDVLPHLRGFMAANSGAAVEPSRRRPDPLTSLMGWREPSAR
jgi:poly(3-hydroxybutyrate) depolymerase